VTLINDIIINYSHVTSINDIIIS